MTRIFCELEEPFAGLGIRSAKRLPGGVELLLVGSVENAAAEQVDARVRCGVSFLEQDATKAADNQNGWLLADRRESVMAVSMSSHAPIWTAESPTPVIYADCGVRVDSVSLTGTAMNTLLRIDFTVIDWERYRQIRDEGVWDGLWFEWLDGQGERMSSGGLGVGEIGEIETGRFYQLDNYAALAEAPDVIQLRGYNCWTKVRYESHAVSLTAR